MNITLRHWNVTEQLIVNYGAIKKTESKILKQTIIFQKH